MYFTIFKIHVVKLAYISFYNNMKNKIFRDEFIAIYEKTCPLNINKNKMNKVVNK